MPTITETESFERSQVTDRPDVIGFPFGSAEPRSEDASRLDRWIIAAVKEMEADPEMKIDIVGWASPPGTESANADLAARRADWMYDRFVSFGADPTRFNIGTGDQPTELELDNGSVEYDNREFRIVSFGKSYVDEPDSKPDTIEAPDSETIEAGANTFARIVEQLIDLIDEHHSLSEPLGPEAPSADAESFFLQAASLSVDTVEVVLSSNPAGAIAIALAKSVAYGMYDVARSGNAGEVATARQPLLLVAALGIVEALLQGDFTADQSEMTREQRSVFAYARYLVNECTTDDKQDMRDMLVQFSEAYEGTDASLAADVHAGARDMLLSSPQANYGNGIDRGVHLDFDNPVIVNHAGDEAYPILDGAGRTILIPYEGTVTGSESEFVVEDSNSVIQEAPPEVHDLSEDRGASSVDSAHYYRGHDGAEVGTDSGMDSCSSDHSSAMSTSTSEKELCLLEDMLTQEESVENESLWTSNDTATNDVEVVVEQAVEQAEEQAEEIAHDAGTEQEVPVQ